VAGGGVQEMPMHVMMIAESSLILIRVFSFLMQQTYDDSKTVHAAKAKSLWTLLRHRRKMQTPQRGE
jgi:hypothetical protein